MIFRGHSSISGFRSFGLGVVILSLLLSSFMQVFLPSQASALEDWMHPDLVLEAQKYTEAAALRNCMDVKDNDPGGWGITRSQAFSGDWFSSDNKGKVHVNYIDNPKGVVDCNDLPGRVLQYTDFSSVFDMFCAISPYFKDGTNCDNDQAAGSKEFNPLDEEIATNSGERGELLASQRFFDNIVVGDIYSDKASAFQKATGGGYLAAESQLLSGAAKYILYYSALMSRSVCSAQETTEDTSYMNVDFYTSAPELLADPTLTRADPVYGDENIPGTQSLKLFIQSQTRDAFDVPVSRLTSDVPVSHSTSTGRTYIANLPIQPLYPYLDGRHDPQVNRISVGVNFPDSLRDADGGAAFDLTSNTDSSGFTTSRLWKGLNTEEVTGKNGLYAFTESAKDDDFNELFGIRGGTDASEGGDKRIYNKFGNCGFIAQKTSEHAEDYKEFAEALLLEGEALPGTGSFYPSVSEVDDTGTSCVVEGIGWIVCGLMRAVASANDLMYGMIADILRLNPITINNDNGDPTPTYTVWQQVRDISNVLLVIAFLIIIFSQITGAGITNYGIKKLMPRIIIVAIAINVSFFVMMLAVDVVNILGMGLYDMFTGVEVDAGVNANWGDLVETLLAGTAVAAAGVAGVAAAGGAGAVALMALPFVLGAVLAIFAAFATLALRNALIIVLAIVAPLAFAAYLLPNTQGLFDKWRKLLTSMLFLYPVAALLFGGAYLAGFIIFAQDGWLNKIFGLFITAAPLFMLPWLAKSSGGILASVGGKLGGLAKSAQGRTQKALAPAIKNQQDLRRAQLGSGARNEFGFKRKEGRRNRSTAYQRSARRSSEKQTKVENAQTDKDNQLKQLANNELPAGNADRSARRARARAHALHDEHTDVSSEKASVEQQAERLATHRKSDLNTRAGQAERSRFGSETQTKRYQSRIDAANKDSIRSVSNPNGDAGLQRAAQETLWNQERSGVSDKEQEGTFKIRQANSSVESTNLRQRGNVADAKTARSDAVVDSKNKQDKAMDTNLQALNNMTSDAKDNAALYEQMEGTRIEERAAKDSGILDIRNQTGAYKQVQQTAQEEIQKSYGEQALDRNSTVGQIIPGTVNPVAGQIKGEAYAQQVVDENRKKVVSAAKQLTRVASAGAVHAGVRHQNGRLSFNNTDRISINGNIPATIDDSTPAGANAVRDKLEEYGAIAFGASLDTFTQADKESLETVQDYTASPEGVEAIATKLIESKNFKIAGLASMVQSRPADERADLVSSINEAAKAAGMDYAAENNLSPSGDFNFYGSKGNPAKAAADLVSKGLGSIPTAALFDPILENELTPMIYGQISGAISAGPNTDEYNSLAYTLKDVDDKKITDIARRSNSKNYGMNPTSLRNTPEYKNLITLRSAGRTR